MAGTMSQADLVADLKRSLHDAAGAFDAPADADWLRLLGVALTAMGNKRPRTLLGLLTLVADTAVYPITAPQFGAYKTHQWGACPPKPWAPQYPGALPRVGAVQDAGLWQLVFEPAPTAAHLAAHGSTFRYWYFGLHAVGAAPEDSTLAAADRPLLLLRAQAEAMRELSMRNVNKAVSLRDGYSGSPRNSTPAALYQALLAEWSAAQ
jgi:hypothetical protein